VVGEALLPRPAPPLTVMTEITAIETSKLLLLLPPQHGFPWPACSAAAAAAQAACWESGSVWMWMALPARPAAAPDGQAGRTVVGDQQGEAVGCRPAEHSVSSQWARALCQ